MFPIFIMLIFKEILWDAGWIWIIMLVMGLATIFNFIRQIMNDAKTDFGEKEGYKKGQGGGPSQEWTVTVRRKKIE